MISAPESLKLDTYWPCELELLLYMKLLCYSESGTWLYYDQLVAELFDPVIVPKLAHSGQIVRWKRSWIAMPDQTRGGENQ
jgi:hypothetical protein